MESISSADNDSLPYADSALKKTRKKTKGKMSKEFVFSILNRVGLVLLGYIVAYMHWSLILPLITIGTLVWLETKTSITGKNLKSKIIANNLSKEDLLKLLDNKLPSWVTFPDRERAEWLNEIVLNLWPNISNYIIKICRTKIQTNIRKKIDSFKFDEIDFGENPPKIYGVKVYSKKKDCIIVDFDVFYDGDCDIKFSISGTQFGRVKDFQLGVEVRVILKPLLIKMPLVGGIQVFFLNTPDINFEIEGFSNLPGLSYLLRQKIEQKIQKVIVFPNNFTKRFTKTIEASELKSLEPEGILRVHVFEAKDLEKKDMTGKSDPYVILMVGAQQHTTQVIKKSLNPKWDDWCEFIILDPFAQQLYFYLYDQDDFNEDDFLGSGAVEINDVLKQNENDKWFKLEKAKHGEVHLRFTWLKLSKDYADLEAAAKETRLLKVSKLAQALLTFFVDSARGLPKSKSFRKPESYFKISIGEEVFFKSKTKRHTTDPQWEQGASFLVQDPENDVLSLDIYDKKSELKICYFQYPIRNLTTQQNLQISKEVFPLVSDDTDTFDSQIVLSLQLRVLTNALFEDEEDSDFDSDVNESKGSSIKSNPTETDTTDSLFSDNSTQLIKQESFPTLSAIKRVPSLKKNIISMNTTPQMLRKSIEKNRVHPTYGKIEMTLNYYEPRQKLIVKIHQLKDLALKDSADEPDPYVKLKLSCPGVHNLKSKTKVISDSFNPVFEETFEYLLSTKDISKSKLVVTVKTKKLFFNSNILGQIVFNLSEYSDKFGEKFWNHFGPEEESD